jgi:hypothetical protein
MADLVQRIWSRVREVIRSSFILCGLSGVVKSRAGTPERELLADDRRVKFTIQELPDDGVFITAQIEGNKVVYSIVLTKGKNPLSRGDVDGRASS